MNRVQLTQIVFTEKAATWTKAIDVRDFRNVTFCLSSSSSANFTIKTQWAFDITNADIDSAIDFSSVASASNPWEYVQLISLNDWASIDWDTWVAFAWTDDVRLYEVNTNWIDYLWFTITAYSAWKVNVYAKCYSNS